MVRMPRIPLQPVPSQKLIYRGQLLQNTQHISDIVTDSDVSILHTLGGVCIHIVQYILN